jgi:hypothetical protein
MKNGAAKKKKPLAEYVPLCAALALSEKRPRPA